jgi:hypothetical protein
MRLAWRESAGRFTRPPSLEATGAIRICECGKIIVPDSSEPFAVQWPHECPECKRPVKQNDRTVAVGNKPSAAEDLPK